MAQGLQEIDGFEVKSVLGKCSALTFRLHLHLRSCALRKGTVDEAWQIIILSCWRIGAKAGGWTVWIPVSVSSQFITSSCFLIPPQTILGSFHSLSPLLCFPTVRARTFWPIYEFRERQVKGTAPNLENLFEFSFLKSKMNGGWVCGWQEEALCLLLKESFSLPDLSQMAREKGREEAQAPSKQANVSSYNAI